MPFSGYLPTSSPGQNDASAIQSEVADIQSWRPVERYAVYFLTSDFVHEMGSRLRPSPERIFECFLEVAAPTDCEGR